MTPLCTVYELTINAYHAIFSAFHSKSKIGFIKLNIYFLLSTTFKTRFFPRIFLFIVEHFIKISKHIFQNRKAFRYQITKFIDLIFTYGLHCIINTCMWWHWSKTRAVISSSKARSILLSVPSVDITWQSICTCNHIHVLTLSESHYWHSRKSLATEFWLSWKSFRQRNLHFDIKLTCYSFKYLHILMHLLTKPGFTKFNYNYKLMALLTLLSTHQF